MRVPATDDSQRRGSRFVSALRLGARARFLSCPVSIEWHVVRRSLSVRGQAAPWPAVGFGEGAAEPLHLRSPVHVSSEKWNADGQLVLGLR